MSSPLSKYLKGVGIKRLSQVEVAPDASNQHEFNGTADFKSIFGKEKRKFTAKFIALSDEEDKIKEEDGTLTWYDARENHPTRSEFRLYYSADDIITSAKADDLVVVAQIDDDHLAVITAPYNSTAEKQLLWLFGNIELRGSFNVRDLTTEKNDIGFAGKYILSSLGFSIIETAPHLLDILLEKFGKRFPPTREFSAFARSMVTDISPLDTPDEALMVWIEKEEVLFKTLEKVLIREQLERGFGKSGDDVNAFIAFSLSVQNRRKSRAGHSFENNLEAVFVANNIRYSHGEATERNNKPDFVFPGIAEYHLAGFDPTLLTMLGLKTTAKDRWRQVLSEAARIPNKHLITLEPAISRNQTEEMRANNLQLIIPSPLQPTFSAEQQETLMNVKEFIELLADRQQKSGNVSTRPLF
jgi:hypothetical protein